MCYVLCVCVCVCGLGNFFYFKRMTNNVQGIKFFVSKNVTVLNILHCPRPLILIIEPIFNEITTPDIAQSCFNPPASQYRVYSFTENFRGVQFLLIDNLYHFAGIIFMAYLLCIVQLCLFCRFIFPVIRLSRKSVKIGPLENFPLCGSIILPLKVVD